MSKRRVVVTGLGMVTPVGNTVEESWINILAGKSGIAPLAHFDVSAYTTRFGGSVKNFDITDKSGIILVQPIKPKSSVPA